MSKRVYIDTSVVGGYFDEEFSFWTDLFFREVENGNFKLAISEILIQELELAPDHVKEFFNNIGDMHKEFIEFDSEAENLANQYINNGIVGIKSITDCRHIAIATYNEVEILASWNFKHIVNLNKIHLYNGINIQNGFRSIEIRTPREIVTYED